MVGLFEPKYKIGRELHGEDRTYSASTVKALWLESDGKCLSCSVPYNFDYEDPNAKMENSNLQIAHIFGLRNFKHLSKGKKKFHIKNESELNKYNNLILICKKCHGNYDKKCTYQEYLKMLELKRKVYVEKGTKEYVYSCLLASQDGIEEIANQLNSGTVFEEYDVAFFNQKIEYNSITPMKSKNMRQNFSEYTPIIETYFNEVNPELGLVLLGLCKQVYRKLKKANHNQTETLDKIKKYFHINELGMDSEISDAIIAYAVWKCEVLEKNVTS